MLKFVTVTKSFGDIVALNDVNLEINPGEFVFITGPSGAGKSTLLNLIVRKYLPDQGEIFLGDRDITKLKGKEVSLLRQNIGVVFQDFKILPERTIRENIEVALAVKGVADSEWRNRVDQVLDMVGLTERAELFPSQVSGGEIQRASLARALVIGPDLILADEPTGNLDWDTADLIMQLFDKVNQTGKTVIVATHHQGIVDKMKKRKVVIRGGKIEGDEGRKAKANGQKKPESAEKVKVKVEEVK
ncbi:ATP-binding cassette domain-containing protein [Candidatus Woesebacteria bacterium]|nr:ATP-binding cassette domain-containing protein [Candidatus Woesebacteria bacterium]